MISIYRIYLMIDHKNTREHLKSITKDFYPKGFSGAEPSELSGTITAAAAAKFLPRFETDSILENKM